MNLEQTIASYQPTEQAAELVRSTKIALLVGISGAGKDTIKREILKNDDFHDIISHTTRNPRVNNDVAEIPDVDYHFIDEKTAATMLDNHEFIEAKFVHGTVYGTSTAALKRIHDMGKIAITDIDVQGVTEYKKLSSDIAAIFIIPPSFATWKERFAERYTSQDQLEYDWNRRRVSAIRELSHALEEPYYHFIINDELAHAVEVVETIAREPHVIRSKDELARQMARQLLTDIKVSLASTHLE